MMDFQNETLTSKPLKELINATILFRKEETLDQLKNYKIELLNDNDNDKLLFIFSAWLSVLYEQNMSMLEDEWDNIKNNTYSTIEILEEDIDSPYYQDVMRAYRFIDKFLYSKGLTKSDTRENITTHSIIKRNKKAGL
jgi:hypothetical protein